MGFDISATLEPGRAYRLASMPTSAEIRAAFAAPGEGQTYSSNYHVTNKRGRKTITYLHLPTDADLRELLESRAVVSDLTGLIDPGWHYGKLARSLVKWLELDAAPLVSAEEFLPQWHYQECRPARLDHATIYDMQGAYWQIACKFKSPVLDIDRARDRLIWRTVSLQAESRWERLKTAIAGCKRLRLAVIGTGAIGWKDPKNRGKVNYWYRGEPRADPFPAGPLQSLALATVRVAYELTQEQSRQSRSFYSNADCISIDGSCPPKLWSDLGIQYRVRAAGAFHVVGIGAWSCGEEFTKPYGALQVISEQLGADIPRQPFAPKRILQPVYYDQVYA